MRDARCDDIGDGNSNRQRGRLFTSGSHKRRIQKLVVVVVRMSDVISSQQFDHERLAEALK